MLDGFNTTLITNPAWRVKPSWYMVAKQDRAINPNLDRTNNAPPISVSNALGFARLNE
jgi:hypothetical protein